MKVYIDTDYGYATVARVRHWFFWKAWEWKVTLHLDRWKTIKGRCDTEKQARMAAMRIYTKEVFGR